MNQLFETLDKEKANRFLQVWSKLDKGSKLDRLVLFSIEQCKQHNLTEKEENQCKELLQDLLKKGFLTKSIDLIYNTQKGYIESILNYSYNKSNNLFEYIFPEKKPKHNSKAKSRSNIDKHFNRSKTNKS